MKPYFSQVQTVRAKPVNGKRVSAVSPPLATKLLVATGVDRFSKIGFVRSFVFVVLTSLTIVFDFQLDLIV